MRDKLEALASLASVQRRAGGPHRCVWHELFKAIHRAQEILEPEPAPKKKTSPLPKKKAKKK